MTTAVAGRLAGKVALVTGGSSGIGRAIALRYAREGAAVAIVSRTPEPHEGGVPTHELISSDGGTAIYLPVDVADAGAAEAAVPRVIDALGGLHIVTTSAGVAGPLGDSREISLAELDENFAVNVRGSFAIIRTALRHFVPQRYGRAIAVSSNFGSVGVAGFATYCMAKAAIDNMARSLAVEFGPYGITVNALCPGSTKTSMSAPAHRDPGIAAAFRAATPLVLENDDYQAEPADIAAAAAFLASDDARFVTGEALIVDGGWNAR